MRTIRMSVLLIRVLFLDRTELAAENFDLRPQLAVLHHRSRRPRPASSVPSSNLSIYTRMSTEAYGAGRPRMYSNLREFIAKSLSRDALARPSRPSCLYRTGY